MKEVILWRVIWIFNWNMLFYNIFFVNKWGVYKLVFVRDFYLILSLKGVYVLILLVVIKLFRVFVVEWVVI